MKKRILLLSIALVSFTAFSFASVTPTATSVAPASISKNVINSFNREFANASNIQWEINANFVKAQFNVNDMVLFAYFNNSGELIAVTRFISPNQLPLELLTSLKKANSNYWVSDLFEIQTETGTSYFATLENADQKVVLKSEGINGWQTFQKEKKDNAE
ncbi:MAG TPA: hypothetical protein VNW49_07810 [Puia sp.]|nr:hypothetical protein [Puia sp.]